MSTRRLSMIRDVPGYIKQIFANARPPVSPEQRLWRERAARLSLDSLGYTNLTVKPHEHNEAVRYARRWFRGMFVPDDDPYATFDAAGIIFKDVRDAVLSVEPILLKEDDDGEDE